MKSPETKPKEACSSDISTKNKLITPMMKTKI